MTPRWQRHLTKVLEREQDVDAVIVFTVPMAHFRGIPTFLRERFGVPVVFYDGDVPMSLPEFGGMDTGFNYYHGADPSEYDLVVSNSEGGLPSLLELGARRAEAVFWGADPEFFAPRPVEKLHDVFFYGYGDKFRRDWMAAMVGEPSRAAPELDFALGGRDFQGDTGRAWLVGDVPFNAFSHAISAARINLNITRRSHATVPGSSSCRPFELAAPAPRSSRTRTRGSSAGSSRGTSCSSSRRRGGAHGLSRACSTTRRRPRRWAPARASACSTSTPTRTAPGSCSRWSASASRQARVSDRRLAIVPARNEEEAVAGVVEELRAFDPELDVVVIDDGSERPHGRSARRRRRAPSSGSRSTSASAAPSRPASSTRSSTATTRWSGSTATASTTRRSSRSCSSPLGAATPTSSSARASPRAAATTGRRSRAGPGSAGSRSSSRC